MIQTAVEGRKVEVYAGMRSRPVPARRDLFADLKPVSTPVAASHKADLATTACTTPKELLISPTDEIEQLIGDWIGEMSAEAAVQRFVESVNGRLPRNAARPGCPEADGAGSCRTPLPEFYKRLFDFYFRDDLYGVWNASSPVILSSGSFDEAVFGLPASLKDCIRYALDQNWYGYSDSRGRMSARTALAGLETARSHARRTVSPEEIVVTLGGTASIGSVVEFLADHIDGDNVAVCGTPNYPPIVAAVARKFPVQLTPLALRDDGICIDLLIDEVRRVRPRLVLLQTVVNPWGRRIDEDAVEAIIEAAPADGWVILDECHDVFGPLPAMTAHRGRPNVISVRSLSKRWAAPGLKAGWIVASQDFTESFYAHASTTYGGPSSLLYLLLEMFGRFESAMLSGLSGQLEPSCKVMTSEFASMPAERLLHGFADYSAGTVAFDQRVRSSRAMVETVLGAAGVEVFTPEYSNNVLVRIGEEPSYVLYRRLVAGVGVSVYPSILALAGAPGMIRLSPCIDEPELLDGLSRLTDAIV